MKYSNFEKKIKKVNLFCFANLSGHTSAQIPNSLSVEDESFQ